MTTRSYSFEGRVLSLWPRSFQGTDFHIVSASVLISCECKRVPLALYHYHTMSGSAFLKTVAVFCLTVLRPLTGQVAKYCYRPKCKLCLSINGSTRICRIHRLDSTRDLYREHCCIRARWAAAHWIKCNNVPSETEKFREKKVPATNNFNCALFRGRKNSDTIFFFT